MGTHWWKGQGHRHHTDNEEGKALLTAETGTVGSQAKSRVAAVRRLSGGPRAGRGRLTALLLFPEGKSWPSVRKVSVCAG